MSPTTSPRPPPEHHGACLGIAASGANRLWSETPNSGPGPGQSLDPWERLEAALPEPQAPLPGVEGLPKDLLSQGVAVDSCPWGWAGGGLRRWEQVAVAARAHPHPGFGELCPPPPCTHESQLQAPLGSWGKAQRALECPQTFRNAASDGLLGLTQDA